MALQFECFVQYRNVALIIKVQTDGFMILCIILSSLCQRSEFYSGLGYQLVASAGAWLLMLLPSSMNG